MNFFESCLTLLIRYLLGCSVSNFLNLQQNLEKSRLIFLILLIDAPGRISRNQNRRNCVVNWILQILISDYHRAPLSLVIPSSKNRHPVVKPTRRWAGAERGADSPSSAAAASRADASTTEGGSGKESASQPGVSENLRFTTLTHKIGRAHV